MKYSWRIAFSILLIIWLWLLYNSYEKTSGLEQKILSLTTEMTVVETIWDMTCIWSWVNWEIRWHANCTYSWFNSKLYSGDIYNHNLNWYGVIDIDNKDWLMYTTTWKSILQEWLFYNWVLVAWLDNENYKKGVRIEKDNWLSLSLWKTNTFFEWEIWEFDENWYLKYWYSWVADLDSLDSLDLDSSKLWYYVWEFNNWALSDWYLVGPWWCKKYINGVMTDVTKTVTNTVYRNNPIDITKGLVPINPLWSQSNPYNVKIELK